jgi:NAD(P) transhydrogenase subunit alpha
MRKSYPMSIDSTKLRLNNRSAFLYSRNVVNLLTLLTTPAKDDQKVAFNLDFEDEIINGAAVTHAGARRGAK